MWPRVFGVVGLGLTVAGIAAAAAPQAQVQRQPVQAPNSCQPASMICYDNAVLARPAADPGIVRDGSEWFLATTGGNKQGTFPLYSSSDMVHWQEAGAIFPRGHAPEWSNGQYWAPEIHKVGDQYVAYFNALEKDSGRLRIGAAVSDNVQGPYKDIGHPLVRNERVSLIDPTFFRDPADGSQYVYWKENGNAQGDPSRLMASRVSGDGLELIGHELEVLRNDPSSWEGTVIEGPEVLKHGDYYYLFYAANNDGTADYAEGVARSKSPLGPFEKAPEPILRSNEQWQGPGHGGLTTDAMGQDWMAYHAWPGSPKDNKQGRQVLIDRIEWSKDGWPTVGTGTPSARAVAPHRQR